MAAILIVLKPILEIICKVVLDVLLEKMNEKKTAEDADRDIARRQRLLSRIRLHKRKNGFDSESGACPAR